jgi:hypothetical protein
VVLPVSSVEAAAPAALSVIDGPGLSLVPSIPLAAGEDELLPVPLGVDVTLGIGLPVVLGTIAVDGVLAPGTAWLLSGGVVAE